MKLNKKVTASLIVAAGLGVTTYSAHATLSQCPAIGASSGCSIVFTFGPGGTITTTVDSTQGPYDGSDDVLVGVQNNSGQTQNLIGLTGYGNGGGIFAFDGDGLQNYTGAPPTPYTYPKGYSPTGYEGPGTWFSNISTTTYFDDTGTVNFLNGLADGQAVFFSLESSPNGLNIKPTTGALPEPGSLALVGLGVAMLGFASRKRKVRG